MQPAHGRQASSGIKAGCAGGGGAAAGRPLCSAAEAPPNTPVPDLHKRQCGASRPPVLASVGTRPNGHRKDSGGSTNADGLPASSGQCPCDHVFSGAVSEWTRKAVHGVVEAVEGWRASMGPCPSGHGKGRGGGCMLPVAGASMGPCPSGHGKIVAHPCLQAEPLMLQWGRVRVDTERHAAGDAHRGDSELQWGRVRVDTERRSQVIIYSPGVYRFNGAVSEWTRKAVCAITCWKRPQLLQWGRVRMDTERAASKS